MIQQNAAKQYQAMSAHTGVMDADPHRLIQMLINGALERISRAKGYMQNDDAEKKGISISSAIGIIGGLQGALDTERGGEVAENLDALYDYMTRRLLRASMDNEEAGLDEVLTLLVEIKSAWEEIRPEAENLFDSKPQSGKNQQQVVN